MRYYVTADVHGYCSQLKAALQTAGFFDDPDPHKLIICGDLFDRGEEAPQLQSFILELLEKDMVILIRGNHEDLTMSLLHQWHLGSFRRDHHYRNGTIDTVCQLTGYGPFDLHFYSDSIGRAFLNTPYVQKIIPAMVDYFETAHYIFTHGWIPCTVVSTDCKQKEYMPVANWRNAEPAIWDKARWINGMEAARNGIIEPGKTIVCGHWHCSFGHCYYENSGCEYGADANYDPYEVRGVILALDACTALSGKVNCVVIED